MDKEKIAMRAEGHANVIWHAIKILENDGFANFAALAKESEGFLTQGALQADDDGREIFADIDLSVIFCVDVDVTRVSLGFKTGSLQHYHCPETNCGLDLHAYSSMEDLANFIVCRGIVGGLTAGLIAPHISVDPPFNFSTSYPSAADRCQQEYDKAVNIWRGREPAGNRGNQGEAMYHLGWACHFLADLSLSPHTVSNEFWFHEDYEDVAQPGRWPEGDSFHATTISRSLSGYGLQQTAREMAAACAAETRPELDFYKRDQFDEGMHRAVPRAERYTARLMAKFFTEIGISDAVPPVHIRMVSENIRIPGAYLFHRRPGLAWELAKADASGQCQLTMMPGEVREFRPAMPGYLFEGHYYGDAPTIPEFPVYGSPVPYTHQARPQQPPTMYLRLRRDFPITGGSMWHEDAVVEVPDWAVRAGEAKAEQLFVVAMGQTWGAPPALAINDVQHPAYLGIQLNYLVDWKTGDIIRNYNELGEHFRTFSPKLRARMRRANTASPSVQQAVQRLRTVSKPATTGQAVKLKAFGIARQMPAGAKELPSRRLPREGLFPVPVPAGSQVRVRIMSTNGCVGSHAGEAPWIGLETDAHGWAWVRVKPGNQAGTLRLFVSATSVPELAPNMLPAEAVELVIWPDRVGSPDTGSARQPVLEQIATGEQNWPGAE